jgi:hypothetical protein
MPWAVSSHHKLEGNHFWTFECNPSGPGGSLVALSLKPAKKSVFLASAGGLRGAESASSWRAFIGRPGSALFCFSKPVGKQGIAIRDGTEDILAAAFVFEDDESLILFQ